LDNLKIKLLGEEKTEFVTRQTQNLEAYNFYLKGLHFWKKRTADDIRKAIENLNQAVEMDPNYALAYAALADSYGLLTSYTYVSPSEALIRAKTAVMKALAIDENLAEAHSSMGYLKSKFEWDWKTAETELKRAIQLNPKYVTAHHWYAEYLTYMGRHKEALEEIQLALELDPLSLLLNHIKGYVLYYARQYNEAIEQFQKTLELDSNFIISHGLLGYAYLRKGMYDEAIANFKKRGDKKKLGYAYALVGRTDEAKVILEEMKEQWKRGEMYEWPIAMIYTALGEEEIALDWLEIAYEKSDPNMRLLKISADIDSLRSNPRFKAILKKMNLE
jgi:tetratricopeptide (TPR) repeat protein